MSQQTQTQIQPQHRNETAKTPQALSDIHNRYSGRLLNNMIAVTRNREDAEDITAAAFAAALKNLDAFRGESSLATWIHAIALNEARNRLRSPRISPESIEESEALEVMAPNPTDQAFERRECCPQIWKALRRVPRLYQRVLIDRFVRGLSVRQVAQRQRIPTGTALSRIFKAKQLLRSAWEV
jgi:RNA polymerase sigma-70 factor (ECF subfamily)